MKGLDGMSEPGGDVRHSLCSLLYGGSLFQQGLTLVGRRALHFPGRLDIGVQRQQLGLLREGQDSVADVLACRRLLSQAIQPFRDGLEF